MLLHEVNARELNDAATPTDGEAGALGLLERLASRFRKLRSRVAAAVGYQRLFNEHFAG